MQQTLEKPKLSLKPKLSNIVTSITILNQVHYVMGKWLCIENKVECSPQIPEETSLVKLIVFRSRGWVIILLDREIYLQRIFGTFITYRKF